MSGSLLRTTAVLAGAALFSSAPARAADLYGKPLRGLTAVSVAAVFAEPAKYAAKAVRVEGRNEGAAGRPALKDGDAVLPILTDGTYTLPEGLAGGTLAAEGKAQTREGRAVFVATGVEVTNRDLTARLLALTGRDERSIDAVADRPGHDRRYSMSAERIRRLGPKRATPRPTPPKRPATSTSRAGYARSPQSDRDSPPTSGLVSRARDIARGPRDGRPSRRCPARPWPH